MPLTIDDLKAVVRDHDANKPRSLQTSIGPSDAGVDCVRRLGYKLSATPKVNNSTDPWAAIVGSAVHQWLDQAFVGDRWRRDVKVTLPGYMSGSADLVDTETRTVIDHKVLGATSLKRYRDLGPSNQYKTQIQLYAAGLEIAGTPVDTVALAFWSRSGFLRDAWLWTAPYDREVVNQALARIDAIKTVLAAGGVTALPSTDDHCTWCPYYLPAATNLSEACPGHINNPTH